MAILVDLSDVGARRSDRVLFEHVSLTISDGDRVGVVGINGTGKSTLLRVVSGVEVAEEGRVVRGRSARVGFLPQEPRLPPGTVRDAVGPGWEADAVLHRLGMLAHASSDVSRLSGGEEKRVALASVLVRESELLVLDEPTNHLDLSAIAWLEDRLVSRSGALVLVTHDRYLLERVTDRIVELDRGRAYVHLGGYDSYLSERSRRDERAAGAEAIRRNLARRELAWLRRGAPARTRKPRARVASALAVTTARAEAAARPFALELRAATPRLGDKVIECEGVGYEHPDGTQVLSGVDLVLDPNDRLGVVGANGAGKSTLLELLAGRRQPTSGVVETGPSVVLGLYDQHGSELDQTARVQEVVAGRARRPGGPEDVALMERFWFTGELPFAPVATLSGGERRRLQLLVVLARRPNVLLLDEPTNDFDLDTLRALEEFLDDWPGALVVVSHDRTFLERATDRLVALRGDGTVSPVPGGVAAWVGAHERPRAGAALEPGTSRGARGEPAERRRDGPEGRGGGATRAAGVAVGRELRGIEREIERATARRDRLAASFSVAGGHEELARLGSELADAQRDLDALEDRWLEVAARGESSR